MKLLMIDNFDSFTYNLVQYLGELGAELHVYRNNAISLSEIRELNPDGIVISPGPGYPASAGITLGLIEEFSGEYPMLGVCLGHQAIAQAFGGKIVPAPELKHGKTSLIFHENENVFAGLESPFRAARYHSLVAEESSLPQCLKVTARSETGLIMALAHQEYPVFGVQFHPESFLTEHGKALLANYLKLAKAS
jgi:anthranilate synthase/aminodeoxychorismate synthase-like glutamine amidotransferase